MAKKKKYIWLILIIIVISMGVWIYLKKSEVKLPEWKTTKIERGNITVNVTATGSLSALKTVDVGTQVSGIIAKLYADFNSEVKKGQVIAILDTSILAATYEELNSMRQKSIIQLNELKIEFERQKKLFEANAIPKAEYDIALTNFQSAQSALNTSNAQLKRARINRQYAIIHAPIEGIVISRNVDVGQTVVSSFNSPVLFTIANDLKKMLVYANVDEADIGQVKAGQKVSFNVDAYPGDNFTGTVQQIRLQPVIVQNVVTYIVVIEVSNPELKLLPGLTANISFKIREHENVLKVQSAVLQFMPSEDYLSKNISHSLIPDIKKHFGKNKLEGDTAYVWIKNNNTLIPVKVALGLIENGYTEIKGNIHEGDEVVIKVHGEEQQPAAKNPFMPSFRQPRRAM
ncbi:MAG: efflux RND transporter periplasmic adaptor subunit [Bacteroidia bacterium]